MEVVEETQLRLNVPSAAALLAILILAVAIPYNALWRRHALEQGALSQVVNTPVPQGKARVVVGLDDVKSKTVTLKYDETVEAVQRELAASGIYDGPIDGVLGKRTELAILAYQRMQGLDLTGAPSPELVDQIQLTRQF